MRVVLCLALVAATAAGCYGDSRFQVLVQNESDQQVILRLTAPELGTRDVVVDPEVSGVALDLPSEALSEVSAAVLTRTCTSTWNGRIRNGGDLIHIAADLSVQVREHPQEPDLGPMVELPTAEPC